MTNNVTRCGEVYETQSENVQPRWYCKIPDETMESLKKRNGNGKTSEQIPITKEECEVRISYDFGIIYENSNK